MNIDDIHSSQESLEDYAEEYIFDRLTPDDKAAYEAHLLVCPECRAALEKTEAFIKLFRQASGEEPGPVQ